MQTKSTLVSSDAAPIGDECSDAAWRERLRFAGIVLLSWGLLALSWIAPTYWVERSHHFPYASAPGIRHVLVEMLCIYAPWTLLTGIAWRVGRRFPFVPGRIARSATVHCIVTLVSVPLVIVSGRILARVAFSLAGSPITLVPLAGALLISSFSIPTYAALVALGQQKSFPFTFRHDPNGGEEDAAAPDLLHSISVRERGRTLIVNLSDVDFIDMADHYLCFHCGPSVHLLRGTLRDIEQRLDQKRFLRVHRSTIVQLDRITRITERRNGDCMLLLKSGAEVAASRSYRRLIASRLRLRGECAK